MSLLLQAAQAAQAAPENWIKGIDEWLGAIDHFIVILGVPAAVIGYFRSRARDRDEAEKARLAREAETQARIKEIAAREIATYTALDDKYLEFERLCFQSPSLDVFDVPDAAPASPEPTPMQKKRELVAFTMLFSLFERAYFMYQHQTSDLRRAQWTGWDEFIAGYCKRANFQAAWKTSGSTFDSHFQKYMQEKIEDGHRTPAPQKAHA
jgi:hypothetical protein